MAKYYKYLSIMAVVLFFTGIVTTAYLLFVLSDQLINAFKITDASQMQEGNLILNTLKIVIGLELFIGTAAILFLVMNNTKAEDIVYITSNLSGKAEKASDNIDAEEIDTSENAAKVKDLVGKIDPKGNLKQGLDHLLSGLAKQTDASQGAIFVNAKSDNKKVVRLLSSFAYHIPESQVLEYEYGEGLTGQVAKEGKLVNITTVPEGYIKILSGLGSATPNNLIIAPIRYKDKTIGVMELSSFRSFQKDELDLIDKISFSLGDLMAKDKTLLDN